MDDKSVFVRVTVCEIPLDAVCDTGASVSCLSPKVFVRLPPKIKSSLKPCSKRLLAANQGEIKVKGEITVEMKIASMTFRHTFLVLEASEAECLLGLDFLETHKCDTMFSEMKLRLDRDTSAKLFHRTAPVQSWHYPVMRVVARETSFIPSGHEAIILGKIDLDDHNLLTKAGIFEPSQSFCDKQNVLAFNTLSGLQEDAIPVRIINPGEDRMIYKGSTLGTFTILQEDTFAQNNVASQSKQKHTAITKYDLKSILHQVKPVMNESSHAKFAQLLRDFSVVFSKDEWDIGKCDLVQHRIQVYPGSTPVKLPNRRMPMNFKTELQEKLDKFLEHELIEPCHSPYSAPAMLVPKKNGKLRLVIDYRQLNKQTIKSCWPIPSIEEIFDTLEGSCYFSTIDMSWGFYQLPMEEASQDYTAFSTPFGSFKWLRMPMGLTGSPNTFQSLMEKVLVGLTWKFTIPYLDDCIIFSRTIEEHLERQREVFQRFKDANLKINPTKCEFFRQKVPFLGHIVSREGIQADPEKTSTVNRYPVPKNATEVKSFLGLCSYYRRYVQDFAKIARPLHQLTEKSKDFLWNSEAQEAFEVLKARLTSAPILAFPSMREPFILYTDASQYAMGAVLAQIQDGSERVICYASKSFSKAQSRYSTTKRELLAIVNFTKLFKHYLLGRKFQIVTDHRALQWLHNFKDPDGLTARWLEKLAAFEYEIVHRSGKSIGHADSMSRIPSPDASMDHAHAPTRGAEAKHPMQNNDETSDTEWPNRPRTNEENAPVTQRKGHMMPKLQKQHLYTRDVEEERSQQSFDFMQIVCHTENSKKFELVKVSGNLFDSTDSIAHSISSDFKLAAGIAKQVREAFPTTYPEFGSKASKEKIYAQQISPNRFIYHLIVKPRFWNKPTYSSLRAALEAMLQHAQKHKVQKISIPRLSTGLDKLNWLKVKGIITNVFQKTLIKVTVYTQPQQQNSSPSGTRKEKGTKNDMQQAQEDDQSLSTVLSWVKNGKQPHRSVLQGQSRDVWVLWNNFDSLKVVNDILCRNFEDSSTGQSFLQQVVPTILRPKILESIHSSTTAAHLGVTKTLEKLRARFYWPGHKKDVSVFVSSCLICQQRNSPKQKHRHSLVNWPPSFPFAHIGIDFLGPLPVSNGNSYIVLFGDHFTKWYEAVPLPDQTAEMTATALLEHWISRFGVPVSIHTDQGRNFESKLFQSLMQSLQIDKTRTTSFHPQSNAVIERMNRTLLNMLAKSVDDFQSNWTQQLPYVMMALRTSVHESTGYTPQFLVFGEEINLPIDFQYPSPEQPNKTDVHQFVQQKRIDMQRAHEAARLHLQAAQLRRNALYNSKLHGPRYKPDDNVWLHSSVISKGLSPKLSSPWKGPYTIVQCLNDVTYKIKNTANQKETIVHYDRLKPFVQRPEELQLPRREPSLPSEPASKSAQKPDSAIHQHCNCSQILSDQIPPNPRSRSASPAPYSAVFVPETPIQGTSAATLKRASSVPSRTTLCSPPQDLSQVPSQAQSPTVINDTFDLSSSSKNLCVPPDSPFSSLSIESLISNAAENLERSATPKASANQTICPRQLRSTTLLQRHAQPLHQLEKHLPSNLKSEHTSQSKRKNSSHKSKHDKKK